ncbi:MAG: metallophosphoesterase [Anaerolineales bacterium]|nr:metallophosphoesterase [Anaerolineales bacterium]
MKKILAVSDQIDPRIYSPNLKTRFADVDVVVACGDLPYLYQEYIITLLGKPLYFVHGNHDPLLEVNEGEARSEPFGAINLHRRIIRRDGLLLAGVEGSILYNKKTTYQYSQRKMWRHVFRLVPGMLINKLTSGRYLDVFVTHAPPRGIHEGEDWTHQGINAFRWLINVFQPAVHLHGHIHVYRPDARIETRVGKTLVINAFRYQVALVDPPAGSSRLA